VTAWPVVAAVAAVVAAAAASGPVRTGGFAAATTTSTSAFALLCEHWFVRGHLKPRDSCRRGRGL
jgi:hypothetical protein